MTTGLASPASEERIGRFLFRGSPWALGWQIAAAGASLVATPFTVRLLGPERYGMLTLIGLIINYAELTDLGMGQASTRFAAQAYSFGDREREVAVIWTCILIFVAPITIVAALVFQSSGAVATWLCKSHVGVIPEVTAALRLSAFALPLRVLSSVWNTPLLVRLRMALWAAAFGGGMIAQTVLTPLILLAGGGLAGAVLVSTITALAILTVNLICARRALPGVLRPVIRRDLIRPLLRFGGASAAAAMAAMIASGGERVLLPRFASLASVAHLSVAFAPVTLMMMLTGVLNPALLAGFARLASTETTELQGLYWRVVRVYAAIAPLLIGLCCLFARPFFTVWAGREYGEQSSVPFYILSVGAATGAIASVPRALITALGRVDLWMRLQVSETVPYLICAVFLIGRMGAAGAAIAWSLRAVVDGMFLFLLASRARSAKY